MRGGDLVSESTGGEEMVNDEGIEDEDDEERDECIQGGVRQTDTQTTLCVAMRWMRRGRRQPTARRQQPVSRNRQRHGSQSHWRPAPNIIRSPAYLTATIQLEASTHKSAKLIIIIIFVILCSTLRGVSFRFCLFCLVFVYIVLYYCMLSLKVNKVVQNPTPALFFVLHDLDFWSFDPKINGCPGLMVKHFCVKFGDPSCIGFWDIVQKTARQTDRQTSLKTIPPNSLNLGLNQCFVCIVKLIHDI